jgi:hypothetical protein
VRFAWQLAPDVELSGSIDRIDRGPEGLIVLDYKLGAQSPSIASLLDKFAPPLDAEMLPPWRPSDLQLPLYAMAVEAGTLEDHADLAGERVAEVSLIYPLQLFTERGKLSDKGRRTVRIVEHEDGCVACQAPASGRGPGTLCRRQLDLIRDRALAAVAGMRRGDADPDPRDGAQTCRSCPFRTICPAPRG